MTTTSKLIDRNWSLESAPYTLRVEVTQSDMMFAETPARALESAICRAASVARVPGLSVGPHPVKIGREQCVIGEYTGDLPREARRLDLRSFPGPAFDLVMRPAPWSLTMPRPR